MARPTKLTATLSAAIVTSLEKGYHVETVSALHGISKDTFYRWLKDGARERQRTEGGKAHPKGVLKPERERLKLCAAFSDACERACAGVEGEAVDVWRRGFVKQMPVVSDGEVIDTREEVDWRAVQSYMERRFPDRWKPRSEQALTGADGGAIKTETSGVDLSQLSTEELRVWTELARKAQPKDGDA